MKGSYSTDDFVMVVDGKEVLPTDEVALFVSNRREVASMSGWKITLTNDNGNVSFPVSDKIFEELKEKGFVKWKTAQT